MEGDKKGRLHIGYNQEFLSLQSYLPMDMVIYQGGLTTMQGELFVAGVTVEVDGVLIRCENITVLDGGAIHMKEMYNKIKQPTRVSCVSWYRRSSACIVGQSDSNHYSLYLKMYSHSFFL